MTDDITRITGTFYAQHAHVLGQDALERIRDHMLKQGRDEFNVTYGTENILLLNGHDRLILPYNILEKSDGGVSPVIGPYANQLYEFTLATPPGEEQDRLEAVRQEGSIDTTLLKVVGPFGPNSVLQFAHIDYLNGNGMVQSTNFPLNTIDVHDQQTVRKAFEQDQDLIYRIEHCKLTDDYA